MHDFSGTHFAPPNMRWETRGHLDCDDDIRYPSKIIPYREIDFSIQRSHLTSWHPGVIIPSGIYASVDFSECTGTTSQASRIGQVKLVYNYVFINCIFDAQRCIGMSFKNCLFIDCTFAPGRYTVNFCTLIGCTLVDCTFDSDRYAAYRDAMMNFRGCKGHDDMVNGCPPGQYIAYKACRLSFISWLLTGRHTCIVKLLIPKNASRVCVSSLGKCRASEAKVLEFQDWENGGKPLPFQKLLTGISWYDTDFRYHIGNTVYPEEEYDSSIYDSCASGIHHYILRDLAVFQAKQYDEE